MNKRIAQRIHAKRRASERYGLTLNRHEMRGIVTQIRRGKAKFLSRESNRLTHWIAKIHGNDTRIVYDSERHTIVTFLPPENANHQSTTGIA